MSNDEFDFILFDRIAVIQNMALKYPELDKWAISYSCGKDSTVLSAIVDLALPNNNIKRIYINTGMEYIDNLRFFDSISKKDKRFIMVKPEMKHLDILNTYGFPFKSKEFSDLYHRKLLNELKDNEIPNYIFHNRISFSLIDLLVSTDLSYPVSDKCCYYSKEKPYFDYASNNNIIVTLTGIRRAEGGRRSKTKNCISVFDDGSVRFHPLLPLENDFIDEFIIRYGIKLSPLYYPPISFVRTGCRGCPLNPKLKTDLETMKKYLSVDYFLACLSFGNVYDTYRHIGYLLN